MTSLPPWFLQLSSNVLGAGAIEPRTPGAIRLLAQMRVPVFGTDRFAQQTGNRSEYHRDVSPLVIALPDTEPRREGPLSGEGVVIKDSLDVAGVRTGLGLIDGGPRAERDATIVARIRRAGGHIAGKAKMTELGIDGLGALMPHPMPENPRAPGYFPGGSSTGSAVAVASGLVRYAVGGDGLGSVRIPSGYCGLVGLKPGQSTLPRDGYLSVAPSMDVPGPMARTVADCARLFQVMADLPVAPLEARIPARLGVIDGLGPDLASASVAEGFERMLRAIGAATRVVEVEGARHHSILAAASAAAEATRSPFSGRILSPAGAMTRALGRAIAATYLDDDPIPFRREREILRASTLRALERVDAICFPTSAIPAPAISRTLLDGGQDGLLLRAVGAYTPLANLTGLPAIAVPCGTDPRGRPLSFMLLGPEGSELDLLRFALAIEETGLATTPVGAA